MQNSSNTLCCLDKGGEKKKETKDLGLWIINMKSKQASDLQA